MATITIDSAAPLGATFASFLRPANERVSGSITVLDTSYTYSYADGVDVTWSGVGLLGVPPLPVLNTPQVGVFDNLAVSNGATYFTMSDFNYTILLLNAQDIYDGEQWFETMLAGDDIISGGRLVMNGYGGNDILTGSTQSDQYIGGTGNDRFVVQGPDLLAGISFHGSGASGQGGVGETDILDVRSNKVFVFSQITNIDAVEIATGATATFDAAQVGPGLAANLSVTGSAGANGLTFNMNAPGSLDLSGFTFTNWTAGQDTIAVFGSSGSDTVLGSSQSELLWGNGGVDILNGGGGTDYLIGGAGGDLLDGGAGFDYAFYAGATSGVAVSMATTVGSGTLGDALGDALVDIEGLIGSEFNDTLFGSAGANEIYGQSGNDRIAGLGGVDILYGNSGSDTFVFNNAAEGADSIGDFITGVDHIEISASGFGGGLTAGALDPGRLVQGGTPTSNVGQFLWQSAPGGVQLFWDPDGTGAMAAQYITGLAGSTSITAGDFIIA